MLKILLLSNMYPSEKSPGYGTFVKQFNDAMLSHGASVERVVIDSSGGGLWEKLTQYLVYFSLSWKALLFSRYDVVYYLESAKDDQLWAEKKMEQKEVSQHDVPNLSFKTLFY